jgi:hypothetical protein
MQSREKSEIKPKLLQVIARMRTASLKERLTWHKGAQMKPATICVMSITAEPTCEQSGTEEHSRLRTHNLTSPCGSPCHGWLTPLHGVPMPPQVHTPTPDSWNPNFDTFYRTFISLLLGLTPKLWRNQVLLFYGSRSQTWQKPMTASSVTYNAETGQVSTRSI